jgi:phosphoribosylformylglycinamidine cyclo-ligase
MPGMYSDEDYDLAGFSVGIVEKSDLIDGTKVSAGDTLIGIASFGPHSNGYSLIRKVIEMSGADLKSDFDGRPLGEQLLTPTRIYIKPLLKLMKEIDLTSWARHSIFNWLQEQGNIIQSEMLKTFNCDIGMVIAVAEKDAITAIKTLIQQGEVVWRIGEITS